ncbi:MAG: hypothetical protein R2867_25550 [Caldilineaceae bacterium]
MQLQEHSVITWQSTTAGNHAGFTARLVDGGAGRGQLLPPLAASTLR